MKQCPGSKPDNIKPHMTHINRFYTNGHRICKDCEKVRNARKNPYNNPRRYGPNADPKARSTYSICGARSRAERLLRYPSWISKQQERQIKALYDLRDKLNKCHEKPYWHIDHIMPLVGKEVSGLHMPENLQLVPSHINLSKSNQWNWETQS